MKQRLLDFIEKLSRKRKIQLAILIFIIGIIVELFIMDLWITIVGPTKIFFPSILLIVIGFFISYLEWFFVEDIMYENRQNKYEKIENEAHERL